MKNAASLASQVSAEVLESEITEARKYKPVNGMQPSVFAYKDLDGNIRVGFNFQPEGTVVGDRFHVDHGVGINRNEDGEVLWMYETKELTDEERSAAAYSAVLAHTTYAGLDNNGDFSVYIVELMKGMRLLCKEYGVDFESFLENEPESELAFPSVIKYPMSEEFAKLADAEGWDLFDCEDGICLCRSDELAIFNNDNEAWDFVIRKAMGGSEFHIAVIAGMKEQNPDEFALWVNEERVVREYHFDSVFTRNKEQALKNLGL